MISGFYLGLAFLVDLIIGDPPGWPHPVRLIGSLIDSLTKFTRRHFSEPHTLLAAGFFIWIIVVGLTWLSSWLLLILFFKLSYAAGVIFSLYMAYTTLAARCLYHETWRVALALRNNDLPRARKLLSMVVGRETKDLNEKEVARAVIETLAENLSDGVIAPLFYLALGGPAMAMAYKAVNTLDSMIGYKDERYLYLGRFSAKMDDVVNYIPARISAALIVCAAWLLGLDANRSYKTWVEHGGRHSSPNAGRPEAAMAGALGVQLGGPGVYHGQLLEKPTIGEPVEQLSEKHILSAENIMIAAAGIMVIPAMIIRSLI